MHLCQEGNEKLFRLHIRRTDKFAEVDVGPDGEGVGVPPGTVLQMETRDPRRYKT